MEDNFVVRGVWKSHKQHRLVPLLFNGYCLLVLDSKTLLLHAEIKLVLTQTLLPCWLAFMTGRLSEGYWRRKKIINSFIICEPFELK